MEERSLVRIKDVARAAGVSPATVSQALNGKGRLPAATRLRVQRIARELGYRPNASARSLSLGRTGIVAIAANVPSSLRTAFIDMDYFSRLIHAATAAATENGFALVVIPATATVDVWDRLSPDGAIVAEPRADDPHATELRVRAVPVVTVGRELDFPDGYWVDNDVPGGTRTILDHLADRGARRVALIGWDWANAYIEDSLATYRAWCAQHGSEPIVEMLPPQIRADPFARLVQRGEVPDAVYTLFEQLALDVLASAAALGIRVPDDLLVAAARDAALAESANPSLTTAEFTPELLGATAVERVIDLIERRPPQPRSLLVPMTIVERVSTARTPAPAGASAERARRD